MFYYLKVNRNEGYMVRNLKHWIESIQCDKNVEYLILCDNQEVKNKILLQIEAVKEENFISSDRTNVEIVEITKNNTSDFWNNASYSHLTTFLDAKKRGLTEFWNIDADDTCFCAEGSRVYEILEKAKKYAVANNMKAFSFDMSRSRRKGTFWSFGITYISNNVDWFEVMMEHCYENYYVNKETVE